MKRRQFKMTFCRIKMTRQANDTWPNMLIYKENSQNIGEALGDRSFSTPES